MDAQSKKRELLKIKADALTESEAAEVLEYIVIMQAMSHQTTGPELFYRALAAGFFKARSERKNRALRH